MKGTTNAAGRVISSRASGRQESIEPEDRLIALALDAREVTPTSLATELAGLDPDSLGFDGWQALTRLEPLLDPRSAWAVRVRSLRRRSHYATTIAAAKAVQISSVLTGAGITHAFFGDLALATAYGLEPGTRVLNYLSLWTDPEVATDQLSAALASVPELREPKGGGQLLRASVGGISIGINRGWPAVMGRQRGRLGTPTVTVVEAQAGTYPVVAPSLEAYHSMLTGRHEGAAAWLLDLQAISAATPGVWTRLPDVAADAERSLTLRWAWQEAAARGAAPSPPRMPRDPPRAQFTQRLGRSTPGTRGRLTPLLGDAAARPNHGPWPVLYDTALGLAALYVGARVTRIDDGGAALLDGVSPIIMAANHQDRLDFDTILITTPKARRRRLRFVANETVLAWLGSGQGLVGRSRAAVLRGVYTHVHRVIPVREHIRGRTAVAAMVDALAAGDTIVIFPEGVLNQTTGVAPLKRGVAALALASGVPILPVRIDGTRGKLPVRHGRLIRNKPRITVRYRPALHLTGEETFSDVLTRLAAALAPPGVEPEPSRAPGGGPAT